MDLGALSDDKLEEMTRGLARDLTVNMQGIADAVDKYNAAIAFFTWHDMMFGKGGHPNCEGMKEATGYVFHGLDAIIQFSKDLVTTGEEFKRCSLEGLSRMGITPPQT